METDSPSAGTLYVVSTPIGHMEDITLRAIHFLKGVDLIAAEDTRHTRKLLTRHEISTPLTSYHDYNKERRIPGLIAKLKSGLSVAIVTDAGTPSISDPGYLLVREAIREEIPVVPIPGVSAMITALSVSGLPTDSFVFIGFAPKKPGKRRQLLEGLREERRTLVFYEAPGRILGLMKAIARVLGDREAALARELTKVHEEILRGPLSHITEEISERSSLKGECTLLVGGAHGEREESQESLRNHLRRLMERRTLSLSDLAREVAKERGLSRKKVYEEALKVKNEG